MKIQTMSIVVGDNSCNASCPYCISKVTGAMDKVKEVNWRNFHIACRLAEKAGTTTVLLTGKGEPTLHPELILRYLNFLSGARYFFPFIELQTNGIKLNSPEYKNKWRVDLKLSTYAGEQEGVKNDWLSLWYAAGLTTICLSAVHYKRERNQEIYGKDYPDIKELVDKLHKIGYTVRLSVMLLKKYIDSKEEVCNLASYCKENKIKQLTIRPIDAPIKQERLISQETLYHDWGKTGEWIAAHTPNKEWLEIQDYVSSEGYCILKLAHGAKVYDFYGQNLCLATCLTTNFDTEHMRQIIFYPDGSIFYDWKFKGAVLL